MTADTAHAEDALISHSTISRDELRTRLRRERVRLAPALVTRASAAAAQHFAACSEYARAHTIAAYVAVSNELDPGPLLACAHASGKRIYLPRIQPDRQLLFARWRPGEPLHENPLGIPEPASGNQTIDPTALDLVIVPLVGFDATGNRLGNGGGYYDRNFAFRNAQAVARPVLAGYAHGMQECPRIEACDWDVPMDLIVTEAGVFYSQRPYSTQTPASKSK